MSDLTNRGDSESDSVIGTPISEDGKASRAGHYGFLGATIAILFGLFYVYDLFGAVSNVAALPAQIELGNRLLSSLGQPTLAVPWPVLIADLLAAPVTFGSAFWLGRRSPVAVKSMYFLVGLTVVAAVSASLVALAGVI